MGKGKILLVEDDAIETMDIKKTVESFGYSVPYVAIDGEEAVAKALELMPDLVLIDIILKGEINSIKAAEEIKNLNIPVIFLTAHSEASKVEKTKSTEPYNYIIKPYNVLELKFAIKLAIHKKNIENELQQTKNDLIDKLNQAQKVAHIGSWEWDLETDEVWWSDETFNIFEVPKNYIPSFEANSEFIHPQDLKKYQKAFQNTLENSENLNLNVRIITDAGVKNCYAQAKLVSDESGAPKKLIGTIMDLTEFKKVQDKLKEKDENYRMLFENSQVCTAITQMDGKVIIANIPFFEMTGYEPDEIQEVNLKNMYQNPQQRKELIEILKTKGHVKYFEVEMLRKDGEKYSAFINVNLIQYQGQDAMMVTAIDITERKKAESTIKKSLEEKNILLKEIHHRVKNNMQIISSLLNLQKQLVEDKEAENVLLESQNRVKSMAMIHEKLYQSHDFTRIDISEYIERLVTDLRYSYAISDDKVTTIIGKDNLNLNIETAIPCGLIINELVSNSLKYAFPEDKTGKLTVSIKARDGWNELIVSDDGVGFPKDLDFKKTETLGLKLVNSLVEQIDGTISLDNTHGTKFKIIFKELSYQKRT